MLEKPARLIFGKGGCAERAFIKSIPFLMFGILTVAGINALLKSADSQEIPETQAIISPSSVVLPTPKSTPTQSNDCTIKQPGQTTWGTATSLGTDPNSISDFRVYSVTYPDGQQFALDLDKWSTTDTGENATGVRGAPSGSTICATR